MRHETFLKWVNAILFVLTMLIFIKHQPVAFLGILSFCIFAIEAPISKKFFHSEKQVISGTLVIIVTSLLFGSIICLYTDNVSIMKEHFPDLLIRFGLSVLSATIGYGLVLVGLFLPEFWKTWKEDFYYLGRWIKLLYIRFCRK